MYNSGNLEQLYQTKRYFLRDNVSLWNNFTNKFLNRGFVRIVSEKKPQQNFYLFFHQVYDYKIRSNYHKPWLFYLISYSFWLNAPNLSLFNINYSYLKPYATLYSPHDLTMSVFGNWILTILYFAFIALRYFLL